MRPQPIPACLARALLAFGLVIAWLVPAASVSVAQVATTITLTPSAPSVPVGGTITVNGAGFQCESTVFIDLMDSSGFKFIVHLGSVGFDPSQPCGSFANAQFTLPNTVSAGQYRVRGSDDFNHSAVSQGAAGLITVGGVSILGTAACSFGDGSTPLPGATVELFSGAALVGTTQASSDPVNPTYTFGGVQANATYQVRYFQANADGPALSCGSVVTPSSDGGQVPASTFCPNEAWDIANEIQSGQNTAINVDTICKPNQSIWRKIAVAPGQQITVTVLGATGKTRVSLFKDLGADFKRLVNAPTGVAAAQQLDASMSGKASAPWDSSPWDSSPWDSSPWDSSPWDSSPWDSSPWDSSPWDSSPWDSSGLCTAAGLSTNQADLCAGAYSGVQMRDLLAFSSNGQITRNTWDTTGFYYIRVFNQDSTFDPKQQLTVLATVVGTCGVPPQTGSAPALNTFASSHLTGPGSTNLPGGATTLILTNTQRLRGANGALLTDSSNQAVMTAFQSAVTTFSGLTMKNGQNVDAILVDFATDAGLQQAYAQWDKPPFSSCPAAANVVSSAIHDLINAYRVQSPGLKYVTILGGHTVVPYRLTPDHAELEIEKRYDPGLLDLSKSAGSLGSGYVMNDSYYVSLNPASRLESEVALPDPGLAVGRLVEFAEDITANLTAFNTNLGVMRPSAALSTGYTFVTDLAKDELNLFQRGGISDTDNLINDTWTAQDLKGKLFDPARDGATGQNFDILALNWHARSNEAVAADYSTTHPTVVKSSDISTWTADRRFSNVLVLSIGCHLAYPLINQDVIPNPTNPPQFVTDAGAFTESFLGQGAMVLGNTGYGYGDTDFEGYSEHLLSLVTQRLETGSPGDGGVPVGVALTNAKRDYILSSAALTGVDKKAVEELTFYGPPMWSVDFPVRTPMPGSNTLPFSPVGANAASQLSAANVVPQYGLTQNSIGNPATSYFEADGGKQEMPFRADLPYKSFDVSRPASGIARGVALIKADYTDATNTTSTVSLPATELSGSRPGWVTHGFWPFETYGLNLLAGQALSVTPIQWLSSNATGTLGTTRSYPNAGNTNLRVFYSNASDGSVLAGPASISDVNVSTTGTSGSLVHLDVTVNGSTIGGVFDVLVTYTGTTSSSPFYGHWKTCSLIPGRSDSDATSQSCSTNIAVLPVLTQPFSFINHYIGDIDAGTAANANDLHLMVQVVTNNGLVSTRDNNGQYFSAENATIANPKAKSTVTIVDPISSPVTYDRSATFVANVTSDKSTCVAGRLVTFHLGSQSKTVAADGSGKATATLTVLTIPTSIDGQTPASYPLDVTVGETTDCLGGFATDASLVKVQKKDTSLAFVNSNAFLAKLVDADNTALRDEFVFFTVKNTTGLVVTRSAQTDANGIAQLRDVQVPAGTYTVTVSFPGTIPSTSGTINLTDERYNAAKPISKSMTADVTPPSCTIVGTGTNSAGQKYVKISVQDSGSGLAAVNPIEQVNLLPLQITSYSAGIKTAVTVTATKKDQSQSSQIALEVDDVAGNVTSCDPILTQVGVDGPGGLPRSESFNHVAHGDSFVTIFNDTPGLDRLQMVVNGHRFAIRDLGDGETRKIDVSSAMRKGANNNITITAQGKARGSALIMIADSP